MLPMTALQGERETQVGTWVMSALDAQAMVACSRNTFTRHGADLRTVLLDFPASRTVSQMDYSS